MIVTRTWSSSASFGIGSTTATLGAFTTGADDLAIYFVYVKPINPGYPVIPDVTPTGSGSSNVQFLGRKSSVSATLPGPDVGDMFLFAYQRRFTGSEPVNMTFDVVDGDVIGATGVVFASNVGGMRAAAAAYFGSDDAGGSLTLTAPFPSVPKWSSNDAGAIAIAKPTDTGAYTGAAWTQTNVTLAFTERVDSGTTLGNDMHAALFTINKVTASSPASQGSTGTFTVNSSGGQVNTYGPVVLVRVYEEPIVAATNVNVRQNGAWKAGKKMVRVGGSWKEVPPTSGKVGGSWAP